MINLEDFIALCNLEGAFCFVSVEEKEREGHFCLKISSLPNSGLYLDNIKHLYNKKVKNVSFDCKQKPIIILIEIE